MALNKKDIFVNVSYAFLGQAVSLLLSVLMTLFVSKVLGVENYGYWQLFIFYVSFAGFLPLGLYDGLYLKLGGRHYEKLNTPLIASLLRLSVLWQVVVLAGVAMLAVMYADGERRTVIIASCVMVILTNLANFIGLMLQTVNRTKQSSIAIIINKLSFILLLAWLLLSDNTDVNIYIGYYILAQVISIGYCLWIAKELVFAGNVCGSRLFRSCFGYMKIGIILTIANVASILVIGVGRFLIDDRWGIESFSIVSFALTLTHFVLVFVNQLGVVFFPALRRCKDDDIKHFYRKSRRILITYMPLAFIAIYPLIALVYGWLPKYEGSIPYFYILLPLCIYDGRMQALGFTMLKVYRKERLMLWLNLSSVGVSLILSLIAIYAFSSMMLTVLAMLIAIVVRSVVSDCYFARMFRQPVFASLLAELLFCVIFVCSNIFLPWYWAIVIFICTYSIYYAFNRFVIKY